MRAPPPPVPPFFVPALREWGVTMRLINPRSTIAQLTRTDWLTLSPDFLDFIVALSRRWISCLLEDTRWEYTELCAQLGILTFSTVRRKQMCAGSVTVSTGAKLDRLRGGRIRWMP